MTGKTLEMEAVELIAKAREEGTIADLINFRQRLKGIIDVTSISHNQMTQIAECDSCIDIHSIQCVKIEKQLKDNIIKALEKDRLL
jgi:hypothetical protein